jgi:hypothetical protein
MWPLGVVEADPVTNDTACVLQGLESIPMHALFFQRPDHALHHAVLLGRVRRDELLTKTVAAHQGGVAATGKDQAVVGAKQERCGHASECAEACNQCLLEGGLRGPRFAAA